LRVQTLPGSSSLPKIFFVVAGIRLFDPLSDRTMGSTGEHSRDRPDPFFSDKNVGLKALAAQFRTSSGGFDEPLLVQTTPSRHSVQLDNAKCCKFRP
jgi:hypothetical protein